MNPISLNNIPDAAPADASAKDRMVFDVIVRIASGISNQKDSLGRRLQSLRSIIYGILPIYLDDDGKPTRLFPADVYAAMTAEDAKLLKREAIVVKYLLEKRAPGSTLAFAPDSEVPPIDLEAIFAPFGL